MNSRPDFAFVRNHPAHLVAFGFGSGLSPIAPGTAGTLLAIPLYWFLRQHSSDYEFLLFLAAAFALGVWACGRTGRDLGVADHGGMVWDEIVAFWLVLTLIPDTLSSEIIGFVLFRFFDIAKPPPIGWLDKRLKGGFGVMFDDIAAAFYTLLVFAFWRFFFP